jgi:hypothetical protein
MFWRTLFRTKRDCHVPLFAIDIYRRPKGSLGHEVHHEPTHTKLYLNFSSNHYPLNKHVVFSTLVSRARALCNLDSLQAELAFLGDIFRQNDNTDRQFRKALKLPLKVAQLDEKPDPVDFLYPVR